MAEPRAIRQSHGIHLILQSAARSAAIAAVMTIAVAVAITVAITITITVAITFRAGALAGIALIEAVVVIAVTVIITATAICIDRRERRQQGVLPRRFCCSKTRKCSGAHKGNRHAADEKWAFCIRHLSSSSSVALSPLSPFSMHHNFVLTKYVNYLYIYNETPLQFK